MANHYLINGDSTTLIPSDVASCDVMIVDPPYSEKVHKSAVSVTWKVRGPIVRKREFGFDHLETHGKLFRFVAQASGLVKRWSVIYSDIESTHHFREACQEAGATYIRTVAWIRWSMPQLSGDRPPSGREDLLIFHGHPSTLDYDSPAPVEDLALFYSKRTPGKKAWNGPGNLTHLSHKCLRGDGKHRAEKPLDQCLDLVEWFSDEGETILDPCAGSGTVGLACAILGRSYVGFELDPQWASFARQRIEAYKATGALSDRDKDRLGRYTEERGKRK